MTRSPPYADVALLTSPAACKACAMTISVLHFSDPACPWAYSASPALSLLRWRFGAQLEWKLVLIGLPEDPARHAHAGYTALDQAQDQKRFRSYGMVFGGHPRE